MLGKIHDVAEILFFLTIGITSVLTSHMLYQQNKLIYKPIVAITDVQTMRVADNENMDKQQKEALSNTRAAIVLFHVTNVGSLPAKNVHFEPHGKIGNTTLPFTDEYNKANGIRLLPNTKATNQAVIGADVLGRMKKGEKLFYDVNIKYKDWEGYEEHSYMQRFEVVITSEKPLNLVVKFVPED